MNGSDFFRKGGDIAVKAFKVVQEKLPQATLQIVGVAEGPKADNVFYKGNVSSKEEIAKMFLNADIVLGPARCDPYPGFIVEAMGFGTPCIVSDRDGMPEIVDNGINGIVLQQLDEASLATAIIDLLPDLDKLKRFSAAAKNKVVTQLNWERLARIIVDKCVPD
jgi:glycosyltransferase involved in cell wall biosynthesis